MADVKLNDEERKLVVAAVALKAQSVQRAAKGSTNPAIAEILQKEYSALLVLNQRLSTT